MNNYKLVKQNSIRCRGSAGLFLLIGLLVTSAAQAELESLTEVELSEVDGAGIGFVLENFKFSHGTDTPGPDGEQARIFKIGGIKSTDGRDVEVIVNQLYIAGSGSEYGTALTPVNLGRLVNPFSIGIRDGNDIGVADKAVLEIAAPTLIDSTQGFDCISRSAVAGSGPCSSRPATADYQGERMDIGLQMNLAVGTDRSANINIHAQSAVIDGSYLRLWGDEDRRQMAGQFKLNFYTPELSINACARDGSTCGNRIIMSDLAMELALGNEFQPVFFDVDGGGNFVVEVAAIDRPQPGAIGADGLEASSDSASWQFYNNYYSNPDYRSHIRMSNFAVGATEFGPARIEGMLVQHLSIRTKDLAQ